MTFLRIWGHTPRSNFKSLIAGENHESKGCQVMGQAQRLSRCGSAIPLILPGHFGKRTELPKDGIYPILAGVLMRGTCSRASRLRPTLRVRTGLYCQFHFSPSLLGICFWRKVREERVWAEYMGEKGGLYLP